MVQGLTNLHHYIPLYVKVFRRVCRLMVISLITIDEEIRRVDGSVHQHDNDEGLSHRICSNILLE